MHFVISLRLSLSIKNKEQRPCAQGQKGNKSQDTSVTVKQRRHYTCLTNCNCQHVCGPNFDKLLVIKPVGDSLHPLFESIWLQVATPAALPHLFYPNPGRIPLLRASGRMNFAFVCALQHHHFVACSAMSLLGLLDPLPCCAQAHTFDCSSVQSTQLIDSQLPPQVRTLAPSAGGRLRTCFAS